MRHQLRGNENESRPKRLDVHLKLWQWRSPIIQFALLQFIMQSWRVHNGYEMRHKLPNVRVICILKWHFMHAEMWGLRAYILV